MTQTARTYGQALYELAKDEHLSAEILEQLQMAVQVFRDNPDYCRLLTLPSVPKAERCEVLDESFRDRVHPYLLNFMKILVEHGTIAQLSGCEEQFRALYHEDYGILAVTAVTATPLSAPLRAKLLSKLASATGKRIELSERVEQEVLGGIRLELPDKRLDGTVRTRLNELRALLLGQFNHE